VEKSRTNLRKITDEFVRGGRGDRGGIGGVGRAWRGVFKSFFVY
jgi:hypothetical protein